MEMPLTMGLVLVICATLVALSGGAAVIVSIIKTINSSHDRAQKWDEYESKIQDIKEEQCMLTYCMMATLDGLHQLGCNGKVTQARSDLDKYMNKQAHGVDR